MVRGRNGTFGVTCLALCGAGQVYCETPPTSITNTTNYLTTPWLKGSNLLLNITYSYHYDVHLSKAEIDSLLNSIKTGKGSSGTTWLEINKDGGSTLHTDLP